MILTLHDTVTLAKAVYSQVDDIAQTLQELGLGDTTVTVVLDAKENASLDCMDIALLGLGVAPVSVLRYLLWLVQKLNESYSAYDFLTERAQDTLSRFLENQ